MGPPLRRVQGIAWYLMVPSDPDARRLVAEAVLESMSQLAYAWAGGRSSVIYATAADTTEAVLERLEAGGFRVTR